MFLMATSAIGPGFITQTTSFTATLGAAFAFAILVSILVDITVQLNVWRVIGVSGRRAQELAEAVLPGMGLLLAGCVVLGGLVFNIGNVAGGGLGLEAMLGLPPGLGGVVTAAAAAALFLERRAGVAMDRAVLLLGMLMILMTGYVAVVSGPPVGAVVRNALLPEQVHFVSIITLIGGTVGGYITYAGAHRLIDAGVSGVGAVPQIARSAVSGILITGAMRVLLFLAILGVVAGGVALDPANPTASAFEAAAEEIGRRVFGLILWAASITSVIGASYTSVSFMTTFHRGLEARRGGLTAAFIAVSTFAYVVLGQAPVTLLIFAGAFNGLILPLGLGLLLWIAAFRSADLLGGHVYPRGLLVLGVLAWALTVYLGYRSLSGLAALWE